MDHTLRKSTIPQKFASMQATSNDYDQINNWYRSCQKNGLPYITIKTKLKYADVHWDYISLSKDAENVLRANSKLVTDGLASLFARYASKNSSCRFNELLAEYQKIDIQFAEILASEIFDLISFFINKK